MGVQGPFGAWPGTGGAAGRLGGEPLLGGDDRFEVILEAEHGVGVGGHLPGDPAGGGVGGVGESFDLAVAAVDALALVLGVGDDGAHGAR